MGQQGTAREITNPIPRKRETEMLINCHMWTMSPQTHILLSAKPSSSFLKNDAVIKMIIKSRSPTMRHVSTTHRVALAWLFDRINLDPKIQIKYVDTRNQLADMLTKVFLHVVNGCDWRPSFRHFCHLFCVVLFCCERLFFTVFSQLYGILF